ncbi:MAG TPA: lysophospholipid acyltransferase family protein [Terriglobales bacterium]|nr:lysophospholipid acyltransferase family protein [Terriglobales bacterium]
MSSSPSVAEPRPTPLSEQREFSLRERIQLWLISWAAYLAIALIGPTLRYAVSWEEEPSQPDATFEKPVIYSFWHRAVFPATWIWRKQKIAVMVSRSFDGEYIARIIERFGFQAVRGSSSRGGSAALLGMKGVLEQGETVAFTIDGPRGPKYIAKPGPVKLSKISGLPMAAFYVALSDAWVLNTWDEFMIPKPFSRALVRLSRKTVVPSDASEEQMAEYRAQLQAMLERVTRFAEENIARVGSSEFSTRSL